MRSTTPGITWRWPTSSRGPTSPPARTAPNADDIAAQFNANLGKTGCITGRGFYYGLDANHGNQIDLVTVLLHEFGHGLGFATFVNKTSGSQFLGLPDVFDTYTVDNSTGKRFRR